MSRLNKLILSVFACFSLALPGRTNSISTVSGGLWQNPLCWQNSQVPSLSVNDTVFIDHPILFQQSLTLSNGAILIIHTSGSLCGHFQVTVSAGSSITNYGEFNSDTVNLPGGHLYNESSGSMIVSMFGFVNNGGSWSNNGGSLSVGSSFTCGQKSIGMAETNEMEVQIFPLPARPGECIFIRNLPGGALHYRIFSFSGTIVCEGNTLQRSIPVPEIADGIYLCEIESGTILYRGKIMVAR